MANNSGNPIDLFDKGNKYILQEIMDEVGTKGLLPAEYTLAMTEFLLFWYFVATLFTTTFALLYYRKFK